MTKLNETIEVDCPVHNIMHHAERYFTVHRRGAIPGKISLTVDLSQLNLPGTAQARHEVRVEHELVQKPGEPEALALAWDPDDRTVPHFSGVLHAVRKEGGGSLLTLSGGYDPPMGVAGAAFDAIVGRRIAVATVRSLLEDVKQFIESDFQTALRTTLASSPKE